MKSVLLFQKKILRYLGLFFLSVFFCSGIYAQSTITGTVSDGNGPIPGANVIVKGTNNGAVTDFDGNYTLNNVPGDAILVFSFVGYEAQEVPVNSRTQVNATLENDLESLNEVVVIGYGTQSRESVTGSVVSIKGDELNEVQSANFQQALQGRAAGVQIQTTSTRPGAAPQIRIRGVRSLSGDNNPLIVLNGIPFSGSLNDINVNDIASLDILKDASATAIYGSRGANGVILIETKTGRKGQKARISINSYYATKEVFSKFPMMNAAELTQLRADVAANNGGTPIFEIGGDEDLANDTDWQDLLYGSGMQTSQDFNISGGSEKGAYGFGMGYFKETSVLPGDKFERYSLTANVDQEVGAFRFGLNSIMNFSKASSIVGPNLGASPLLSPFDENGDFLESVRLRTSADQLWIPTRNEINRIGERRTNDQLDFGTYNNIFAEVNIPGIEGLKYRLNLGLNLRTSRDGNFTGQGVFNFNPTSPSNASYDTGMTRDYVIENQILYDRTFADKHKVNFVGLFSSQKTEIESSGIGVQNLFNEKFLFYNLDASLAEDITRYGTNFTEYGLLSYMGRVLYQYDNRYLFTATLRADGSSRLAPGYKWVTYPAVSLGWNIANESFMSDVKFINQLKLRAGYGETSNQAIAPYSTQGNLGTRNYNFGSTFATGYFVSLLPNPTLGWEFSETYNYGLDFSIFNSRLSGTVEYYLTKTNDILYTLGLPPTSGVNNVRSNIGSTENKGIEISLNGTIIDTPDFTWDAGLNLYSNRNEITSLATGEDQNVNSLWFVGSPINVIFDYDRIGLWNESDPDYQFISQYEPGDNNPGMIKVRYTGEFNEDGSPVRAIGPDDRIIIDPTPDFQGGFNTRIAYKNFDLSAVGTFQKGGIVVSTLYSSNGYLNLLTGRSNNVRVDYWTPENTDAKYPAPGGVQSGDNQKYASTLGYFDGSFLRFRTITFGYNFEQNLLDKLGIQNLRVYATAQNPFVFFSDFKKESGLDPETNSGINGDGTRQNVAVNTAQISTGIPTIGSNAPTTRNYLLGLNISF
ncbi:SusC/RagA family TonB-linked outer membrane protein [Leeuwenhoekiella parthenopeia]|uniref:TonB-dependent receptor n=1 Tax=Leeuwenhoekiella parthenopeia TaxID=2890320 RepID=A0ABS8GMI6_9FLAO|nr:TonB-dependent receptor [Leeuwenhoekiella parthenopeia]MCC4211189.1 TonB-dependent receptor [Leeuwenhoekiella parthenopeia]